MASAAPFIMKIKYYAPAGGNREKNVDHIDYIANRPGVDKGELEPEIRSVAADEDYVSYINSRPGSFGLFGEKENGLDIKPIQEELREHQGIVWRMVLSVREDDAMRIGYTSRAAWEKMLRSQIYTAAGKMGIERSNLRWCSAFHEAKGHPHAHLVMWEKTPQRTTGALAPAELREVKKIFASEIYREERLKMMMEKTAARDLVREKAKGSLTEAKEVLRKLRVQGNEGVMDLTALFGSSSSSLPPELQKSKILADQLYSLSSKLPGKGRAALQFMPGNVKQQAKDIADYLLRQPGFREEVEKYLAAQEQLAKTYSHQPRQIKEAGKKAYDDLQIRVANLVVRGAADLNRWENQDRWDTQIKAMQTGRTANIVWKACWRAVESERKISEAQAELHKRISVRRQAKQQGAAVRYKRRQNNRSERSFDE